MRVAPNRQWHWPEATGVSIAALLLAGVACSRAATYYLDSVSGHDTNTGLSPATAWRTVSRANQQAYAAGDRVLLKRGCVWQGPGFVANGNGTPESPITLADYGSLEAAMPVIDGVGPHEPAVLLQNVQNWVVRNLELTQHGQTPQALDSNNEKGKDADQYSDEYMRAVVHILGLGPAGVTGCGEGCTVRNIRLENLLVRDGTWNGIYASGGFYQLRSDRYGYLDNLVVQGVESRNNHKAGVEITCTYYQERVYAASNVWVLDSYLHHNGGDGAMAGPVRSGVLDGNLCSYNGRVRNARVGCWTWDSEDTVIQFNESHHNMTPLTDGKARDGAGFDLDLGSENGLIQYNWSHDNEGEGYLFVSWPVGYGYNRGESHNCHMRYNLSERDGKKLAGGVTVFGGVQPLVMYNNLVYYEPDRLAGTVMFNGEGGAVTTSIWGKSGKPDVRAYNNVFIVNGRTNPAAVANLAWSDANGTFTFDNNLWWRVEGGARFQWGSTTVSSWSTWLANGFDVHSFNADPRVTGRLGNGPAAYLLQAGSPAIDAGRNVADGLRGMGFQDAAGATVFQGAAFEIGPYEYRRIFPDTATPRLTTLRPVAGGGWKLEFTGMPGRNYRVEHSADLKSWQNLGTAYNISGAIFGFTDPRAGASHYYRAATRAVPGL